ncbi:hypothetical protein ACFYUH_06575 [Streptomyces fimicarius]|uniref:hypothetical protein n=1 Tax=Streptomyces griseus TaxID=1911 RepID=UPI0036C35F68
MAIDHAGRAVLAQELKAKETAAGLILRHATRSRAAAIQAAGIRCREVGTEGPGKSAVNDWVVKGAPATDFRQLWAYVAVLDQWAHERDAHSSARTVGAVRADRAHWKQLWENARRQSNGVQPASADKPDLLRLGRPAAGFDPVKELEVHPAIDTPGRPSDPLPTYVPRSHDAELKKVATSAEQASQMVILVADSSAGKSRAWWEALQHLPTGWHVWRPADRTELLAALESGPSIARTVLWLNETQRFLDKTREGERTAASLTSLLLSPERGPVLIAGTLWRKNLSDLAPRTDDPSARSPVTALLNAAHIVRIPESFDTQDLEALRPLARRDSRLAEAMEHGATRITQYLAGARELLARYEQAPPEARALLDAAADARRLGHVPALTQTFLRHAAAAYLDPDDWAVQTSQWRSMWFEQALQYTSQPCRGVPGPLAPQAPPVGAPDEVPAPLLLADYVLLHTIRSRQLTFPPEGFWDAAACHIEDNPSLRTMAFAADERLRFGIADRLATALATAGDPTVLAELADLRDGEQGSLMHSLASAAGHGPSLSALTWECLDKDDWKGAAAFARQALTAGSDDGMTRLVHAHFDRGKRKVAVALAREAARAGHGGPLSTVAESHMMAGLAKKALRLALEAAAAGNTHALEWQITRLVYAGEFVAAESLAREAAIAGDAHPLASIASHYLEAEQWAKAEALAHEVAATGHGDALSHLAAEYAKAQEWAKAERLARQAADAGSGLGMQWLADIRGEEGDWETVESWAHQAAAAGAEYALNQLVRRLLEAGELDTAERLAPIASPHELPPPLSAVALARWNANERERAMELAREAAAAGEGLALAEIAMLQWEAGEPATALALGREAAAAGEGLALAEIAMLQWEAGKLDCSEELAREAAGAGNALALAEIARRQLEAGHIDAAERVSLLAINAGGITAMEFIEDQEAYMDAFSICMGHGLDAQGRRTCAGGTTDPNSPLHTVDLPAS